METRRNTASDLKQHTALYRYHALALLAGLTVFRLLIAGRFGLSTDESHYVLYARNLAWGYFDHPPMVAFLGALTMQLGDSVFYARLGPIICSLLAMIILWRLVANIYQDEKLAAYALALFMLIPINHLLGVALLPDATLNLFWCAGLFTVWFALERGEWRWWIATGVLLGGALLSKYHAVLFPLCVLIYIISFKKTWPWLWNVKPYVSGLIALLIFLPNIMWNSQHEWISYLFQLGHGGGQGVFKLQNLFKSLGGQLAVGSPVLFVLFLLVALNLIRNRAASKEDRFFLCVSLPVFAFFCLIGLFGKVLPHWPAVAWFGAAPLLAVSWTRAMQSGSQIAQRWHKWGRIGVAVAAGMIMLMYSAITLPLTRSAYRAAESVSQQISALIPAIPAMPPFQTKFDITNDLYGWEEVAAQIEELRASMPNPDKTFVFCHRFFLMSQIGVFLQRETVRTSLEDRASQYLLWFNPEKYRDWDALFIDYHMRWHQGPDRYRPLFEDIDQKSERIEIYRGGEIVHSFDIFRYYGFKGHREGGA